MLVFYPREENCSLLLMLAFYPREEKSFSVTDVGVLVTLTNVYVCFEFEDNT